MVLCGSNKLDLYRTFSFFAFTFIPIIVECYHSEEIIGEKNSQSIFTPRRKGSMSTELTVKILEKNRTD